MSSGIDKNRVLAYYQKMSDAEIINALTNDARGLTQEALQIVKEEIGRRNLPVDLIETVDVQQEEHIHIPKAYNRHDAPIAQEDRVRLENSFQLLVELFGRDNTQSRKVLVPDSVDFPVFYNGSEESAMRTLKIIANQMEVPFENIMLDFYEDDVRVITEGSPGGLYHGMGAHGKFEISIVETLLEEPEKMVATLAHEIAHIKLLGENRLEENDEPLTDLTTIFFGMGVFNANAAFQTFADSKYYGWSTSGYLTQMEWGYALSLFARLRGEDEPAWANHLCTNVRADFRQGQNFILNNEDKILVDF